MLSALLKKHLGHMHVIYLHGFQSNHRSVKGQLLATYCQQHVPEINVYLPDLNQSPHAVVQLLDQYIQDHTDKHLVCVGSSLGGFYANYLASQYYLPAVLINPAISPWQLFNSRFGHDQLPFAVTTDWTLTQDDLNYLQYDMAHKPQDLKKILLLLQQGDEILDYRHAARYYHAEDSQCMMILEQQGDHVMRNFADKIPMLLMFLVHRCLSRNL